MGLREVGAAIKAARLAAKLRQEDVADLLGVTQSAVSTWEQGEGLQGLDTLVKLAGIYGRDVNHLVAGLDESYERLGLTRPVSGESTNGGTKKKGGASDVIPASAQARIRELEDELRSFKAEVSNRALALADLAAADTRLRTPRTHSAGRRRSRRENR